MINANLIFIERDEQSYFIHLNEQCRHQEGTFLTFHKVGVKINQLLVNRLFLCVTAGGKNQ